MTTSWHSFDDVPFFVLVYVLRGKFFYRTQSMAGLELAVSCAQWLDCYTTAQWRIAALLHGVERHFLAPYLAELTAVLLEKTRHLMSSSRGGGTVGGHHN